MTELYDVISQNSSLPQRLGRIFHSLIICFAIACCALGCYRPLSYGQIIEGYKAAPCIPVSANRTVKGPHTREWETTVILSDGSKVMVVGAQMPGGRITVRNLTTARESEAANAGDYVYPSDVRFDGHTNLLFVKVSGLAAGIVHETWLFEYDLLAQRLVQRRRVLDNALPTECPESP